MDYYLKYLTQQNLKWVRKNDNIRLGDTPIFYFNSTWVWQHIIRNFVQKIHI